MHNNMLDIAVVKVDMSPASLGLLYIKMLVVCNTTQSLLMGGRFHLIRSKLKMLALPQEEHTLLFTFIRDRTYKVPSV